MEERQIVNVENKECVRPKASPLVNAVKNMLLYGTIFVASAAAGTFVGGEIGERTAPPKQKSGYLLGNPAYSEHVRDYALTGLEIGSGAGLLISLGVGLARSKK